MPLLAKYGDYMKKSMFLVSIACLSIISVFVVYLLHDSKRNVHKDVRARTKYLTHKLESTAAYEAAYSATMIDGVILGNFADKVKALPPHAKNIIVYSKGGSSGTALKVAKEIKKRGLNVFILGVCTSACAEFLLPAAKQLTFIENPMVGFHGNKISSMYFAQQLIGDSEEKYCFSSHVEQVKKFHLNTLGKFDFWKTQYQHLIIQNTELIDNNLDIGYKCKTVNVQTKNSIWYPTSKQLREEYGLEFEGTVCADKYECYSTVLTEYNDNGDSFAVANSEYIVKK